MTIGMTAHGVRLWWPNGFGAQPLYNLSVSLAFDEDFPAATSASVEATRRIGFRYAVLVTGNDTDPSYVNAAATQEGSDGLTFIFRVNGAPVYAKVRLLMFPFPPVFANVSSSMVRLLRVGTWCPWRSWKAVRALMLCGTWS